MRQRESQQMFIERREKGLWSVDLSWVAGNELKKFVTLVTQILVFMKCFRVFLSQNFHSIARVFVCCSQIIAKIEFTNHRFRWQRGSWYLFSNSPKFSYRHVDVVDEMCYQKKLLPVVGWSLHSILKWNYQFSAQMTRPSKLRIELRNLFRNDILIKQVLHFHEKFKY